MSIVLMLPEEEIKNNVKYHRVKHLSDGIQKFYNGPCAAVVIDSSDNIEEILNTIKLAIDKHNSA